MSGAVLFATHSAISEKRVLRDSIQTQKAVTKGIMGTVVGAFLAGGAGFFIPLAFYIVIPLTAAITTNKAVRKTSHWLYGEPVLSERERILRQKALQARNKYD